MLFRSLKKYEKSFKFDFKEKLQQIDPSYYESFEEIFENILDTHAPNKTEVSRANDKP